MNKDNEQREISRRSRLDLNEPAELAIYNAMQEVEKMPADIRLTDAVNKLHEAKNLVADYIDSRAADSNVIERRRELGREMWIKNVLKFQPEITRLEAEQLYAKIYSSEPIVK